MLCDEQLLKHTFQEKVQKQFYKNFTKHVFDLHWMDLSVSESFRKSLEYFWKKLLTPRAMYQFCD